MKCPVKVLCLVVLVYIHTDRVLLECNIPNCVKDNCTGDICESCIDGHYLKTNGFCGNCPTSCVSCRSLTNCTACIPERHGTYCQNNCPVGCKNRNCDDHTGRCRDGCAHGYYLHNNNLCTGCQFCINGSCDAVTGSCDIGCIDGYYRGTNGFCTACAKTCKDRACDRITGACTKGCVSNHYLDNLGSCQGCSVSCKDLVCEDGTGFCTNGCIDYYYMTATKTCADCPVECVDRKCHSITGTCDLGCVDQYYMTSYNVCKSCPSSCINRLCHDKTAYCKEGCIHGYYLAGGTCKTCSSRCKDRCADASGACEQCKKGYYMDINGNCQYCPKQCSSCSQGNEVVCNECKTGYWGDNCATECFEGCMSDLCHATEGYCLKGCNDGYSDELCDIPSTKDSVIIGLSVTVGILCVIMITAIVLFIIKMRRGALCSPRELLFCLPKTKKTESRQETKGANCRPTIDSVNYVVPTWSPGDPEYTSLSGTRGYERPVPASDDH